MTAGVRIYYDRDADRARLADRTFAIIGFGSQGHAHALNLKESGARVIVVEAGPRVLGPFTEYLSRTAETALERLDVVVRTNTRVTDVAADHVRLMSGDATELVETHTVVWAAGVRASPLAAALTTLIRPAGALSTPPVMRTSPPTTLSTCPSFTVRAAWSTTMPAGPARRKPKALGGAVVRTLSAGFEALKLPPSWRRISSAVVTANAPGTSMLAPGPR